MRTSWIIFVVLLLFVAIAQAQDPVQLYRALATNGLDGTRVFRVRDATLDVEDLHFTLTDGVIGLLEPVDGHTTGAFFEGEGEVLVVPPTQVERESLALHTGAAVLEERFTTASFRFSDDFSPTLMDATRGPAPAPQAFVDKWAPAARTLSNGDALALLAVLTRAAEGRSQRVFHARVAGSRLGTFDLRLDTAYDEQVVLGQANYVEGAVYYDIWTQFPMRSMRIGRNAAWTFGEPLSELGPHNITIRRCKIAARIQPPHQLDGDATLEVEAVDAGDRTLVFQLSRYLHVSSAIANGAPVAVIQNEALQGGDLARRGNDLVAIVLPQPIKKGEKLQLRFQYSGDVLSEAGGGLMYVGARGNWYPNQGPAMVEYELDFRYSAPWTLLATGKRVSQNATAGEQHSVWISERPIPMAGFNLGEYSVASAKAGQTQVETYAARGVEAGLAPRPQVIEGAPTSPKAGGAAVLAAPPPRTAAHASAVAHDAAEAIGFVAGRLAPFPYASLALSQMPGRISLGWPGLVFVSSYVFLSPAERGALSFNAMDEIFYGHLMSAHEVAHEWWGDSVMPRGYRNDWLMEALANEYALMLVESERPQDFRISMDSYRDRLLHAPPNGRPAKDAGPVTLGFRLISSKVPAAYDTVLYGRGTWLLHMLRHLFRDSCAAQCAKEPDALFLQVLRKVYLEHQGRELSTADLQKAFEEALPRSVWFEGRKSLDWFFDGWVSGTAIPFYELKQVKITSRAGASFATGKLMQDDAPDRLVTSVPLYASSGASKDGDAPSEKLVYVGRVFADGPETTFRLNVPAGTKKLLIDPYSTVLRQP
jgi:peptidase M1-like protein